MLTQLLYYISFPFLLFGGYIILFNAFTLLRAYKQWGKERMSAIPIFGALIFFVGLLFYTDFSAPFYIYFIPFCLDYTILAIPVAIYQHKDSIIIYEKNKCIYLLDKYIVRYLCNTNHINMISIPKQYISSTQYLENIQKYVYCSCIKINNELNIILSGFKGIIHCTKGPVYFKFKPLSKDSIEIYYYTDFSIENYDNPTSIDIEEHPFDNIMNN